ncbi:hypothetical protein [Phytohabitans aurantiacus]|uniref:Secreted protein n=1 Tax=Phytohabitans aurantiacus TaxID=3016789 RepID=A0ABQ5RAI4_9ACTN|nr:hypothetical protein [Phytohabitans aurantiacus]GLI03769.1 hypothetical protein Pa4123_90490 [Phytohabitans aurantiacus]
MRARLLFAAVAALTAAAFPGAAAAATAPWITVRCATGAMTAKYTPGGTVTVSGWIQPCPTAIDLPTRFAVAYYGEKAAGTGELLPYTGGLTAPTEFTRSFDAAQLSEPLRAVCLVYSPRPTGRIACVRVDPADESELPQITPIPTDDLLTTRPLDDPVRDHFCGTCV